MADDFARYVQQFESAEEASQSGRTDATQARAYFDGNQFTAAEMEALRKRRQPVTPENLIRPKIEGMCGLERQSRTDPKAYPRTQQHDEAANAVTDALRYVSDDQNLDIKISQAFAEMLVEGECAVEVSVKQLKNGVIDPQVIRIAYHRLYGDPHSSEPDRSDAAFVGYVTWMDVDAAKLKWPDKTDILESTVNKATSSAFDAYEDKPTWASWYDPKRKRIRINTHYALEKGQWTRCIFTLAGELEDIAPSPYIDDEGNPECPLIMQGCYVDQDNDRYGIVRDMIPLQDEVNKRRSKFLHMVNNAKVRVSPAVGQDKELIRREMARPDGVIVGEQGEVEELGNLNKETGQFQLLADTRASLKGIGPNAHMQGKDGSDQSGRAIMAMQQAGMTEMTPVLDNLRHLKIRIFRQIWNRIRQYWTAERWVRVTDDEKNVRFVGLNVTKAHLAMQKLGEAVKSGQVPMDVARQYEQQIMFDPAMQQPANQVAELDVDIDIDEVNETPTLQIEQFEALVQLASTGMVPIPPELIIQASNLRDKQKLLEIIEQQKQGASQPDPMQELAVASEQAKIGKTEAETVLITAKAQNEGIKPMIEGAKLGQSAQQPPIPDAA